jgi:hypothetical protein
MLCRGIQEGQAAGDSDLIYEDVSKRQSIPTESLVSGSLWKKARHSLNSKLEVDSFSLVQTTRLGTGN